MTNRVLISDILNKVSFYLDKKQVDKIYQAYLVAAKAHDGQYRKSGEAYVFHPLAVAMILVDLEVDYESIIAAILHDCIEDTSVTKGEIEEQFGKDVAHIVDGVSKLSGLEHKSVGEKQAKNFRKLLLAASKDIRVIVIKLADRLHNLRTIDAMSRDSQIRIAKETQSVYIPISRRIGIGKITKELKELAFKVIHPLKYKTLLLKTQGKFDKNQHLLRDVISNFEEKITAIGITAKITGRKKDIVSIYQKMRDKKLKFAQVLDLYGIRIIVNTISECYQVLGVVHNTCSPIPGSFKDYIALPKNNGYQSLHTVVFGKNRQSIEVQIRTYEMEGVASYGLASHWYYKNNHANNPSNTLTPQWISNIHKDEDSDEDFLNKAQAEMSSDDIFVFTPKGKIIQLPYLSTALDFAYEVHTDVGDRALRVKIDNINKSLNAKIKSGQTIEIITSPKIQTTIEFLDIATTIRAKVAIKNTLKNNFKNKLVVSGKEILSDSLYYFGINIDTIEWQNHLKNLNIETKQDLFIKLTLKELLLAKVLSEIIGDKFSQIIDNDVKNSQQLVINCAKCCYPLPEDDVIGILSLHRGLQIHRQNCRNNKGSVTKIDWKPKNDDIFESKIICEVDSQANFAKLINSLDGNIITDIQIRNNILDIVLKVHNLDMLNTIIHTLSELKFVNSVSRFLL